eukprot:GFUD01040113.1.p1 GENE.GFUD01040113.1~~GFUD01040113.1.p1  ORF type:complete len:1327 (-),score=341.09 GFUD01040113.1:265-4245(-)
MHVSYAPNVVDHEVMSEVSLPRPNPRPSSTSKIMIGRRKPSGLPPNQSSVSNASLISGLSGSYVGSIKNTLPVGPVGKAMVRVGGTATPNRGPGRFVSVNLGKNTGAEAVARQTQMVMKNLKNFQDGLLQSSGLDMTPPRSLSQGVELPRSYSQTRDNENMPSYIPSVQSNSPARSRLPLSPLKNMNNLVLNEISQEFSPSPVKRVAGREMFVNRVVTEPIVETAAHDMITSTSAKAYVSIARMDVSEYARKDATKQAMEAPVADTSDENTEEVDVLVRNLPRPSDSFQPTPARFANINGKKSTRKIKAFRKNPKETVECVNNDEVEEDNEVEEDSEVGGTNNVKKPFKPGVGRPSEADLGFVPPTRAPSVMSEVTFNFKKPSLIAAPPKVSGTKRKEAPEVNDTLQGECRYLQSWIPRLRNKRLYVEGDLLDLDNSSRGVGQDQRWVTSKIVKRHSSNRVATKKGTVYVLEGQLVVRNVEGDNVVGDAPTPNFILDKFNDGFPENWERLTNHWIKFNDQNSINAVNMSIFNSTRMTNMSMTNMTAFENISSISAANASRYLTSRPKVPDSQVTFNNGPNLSTLPEEEQDLTRPQVEVVVDRTTTSRSRSNKGKSGAKTSTGRDNSDHRSRSPLRKEDQVEGAGSPQAEHRSRSKTVRQNNNSRRKEVRDTSPVANLLEVTMSMHDFTLLRAKTYTNIVTVNKKKNYNCHFCEFLTTIFLTLKNHIKEHHLDEGVTSNPLPAPRSQSDESVLATPTPAKPKPRRSSFSPTKIAQARLADDRTQPTTEEQLANGTVAKNNLHCKECNFETKSKAGFTSHMKSKKHVERMKNGRSRSRRSSDRIQTAQLKSTEKSRSEAVKVADASEGSDSKSPRSKTNRSRSSPKSKSRSKSRKCLSPERSKSPPQFIPPPSKGSSSDKSKRRQSHIPGLGTFVCFACDISSNEDLEMFNHLMSSGHGRKVKTCVEKRYLSCNVCLHFTNRKDDFIKHMRSEKHIQTLTKIKGGNLEKQDVLEKAVEINKSLEENLRNTKKQSSFGRNIKKPKALTRKSCEYGTPEEIVEEAVPSKRPHNSRKPKHQVNESLRRTVLNPFKRVELEDPPVRNIVKSTEDILEKMSANPKTVVKQKQQNVDALKEFNENHEDDIFDEPNKSKSKSTLLKPSTKTLLSQESDSDSDSEQDISVHSARTPMTSYFGKSGLRTTTPMLNQDKTPGILTQDSPTVTVNGEGFQAQAYIQKKVAEQAKDSRKLKRNKLATALVSKVVSRSQADKQVDQSSQIINTVRNHTANIDEEEDQADDWFDDDDLSLSKNLSCDPGAGLLELLSRQPDK